jgi:fatty-acyl-CoA synthase
VQVPLNTRLVGESLGYLLGHCEPAHVIADAEFADALRAALPAGYRGGVIWREAARDTFAPGDLDLADLLRGAATPAPGTGAQGEARGDRPPGSPVVAILYTSGTTGAPKGVMLTHAHLLWAALACAGARGDTEDGVGASISPLTHTPVFVSHLLCRILTGATTVLLEKFDLPALLDSVARHGVTDLPLIGGMTFEMVALGRIPAAVRRTVRKVSVGGAPTPMSTKRQLAERFDGAEIIEAYGQTESTDGVTMARGGSVFDRPGTVGRPNPHVAVGVRRADGTLAAAGEEGEVVIGGPTIMAGYYRDAAATAAAVRDGWLHTGDRGRQDGDGYLFITGRVKDLIITGGENVSPIEVEDVLRAHPDVADVAVIGTPHPKWGEQVTAVVVTRRGARLDAAAISEFAGRRLAGFKKPRRVEFVDRLPRNAARKVMTGALRQRFGRESH